MRPLLIGKQEIGMNTLVAYTRPAGLLPYTYRLILAAVLVGAMLVLSQEGRAQGADRGPDMITVIQSPLSFPATVEAFRQQAAAAGWSILNVNNMAGVLSARGYTLHPVKIIDVCSGKYSARILERDEFRPISALMPCRVSIYQTSAGEVFIARMNVQAFLPMMPDAVADIMQASDEEIAEIIAKTVRR
jgi:uncharacterized protein (DUF302 family)